VASTPRLLEAIKRIEQTGEEAQRAIGEGIASMDGARERLLAVCPFRRSSLTSSRKVVAKPV
jgi:hypothetical protein